MNNMFSQSLNIKSNTCPKRFVVLYSGCHQGPNLHSCKFISCILFHQPCSLFSILSLLSSIFCCCLIEISQLSTTTRIVLSPPSIPLCFGAKPLLFGNPTCLLKLIPSNRHYAALKLALPSEPSCIKVSIPLIAMIVFHVGILIEAFGSGGVQ